MHLHCVDKSSTGVFAARLLWAVGSGRLMLRLDFQGFVVKALTSIGEGGRHRTGCQRHCILSRSRCRAPRSSAMAGGSVLCTGDGDGEPCHATCLSSRLRQGSQPQTPPRGSGGSALGQDAVLELAWPSQLETLPQVPWRSRGSLCHPRPALLYVCLQ